MEFAEREEMNLRKTIQVKEKIKYLRDYLSNDALYEQLAEECCELAQASLKYLRSTGNGNPTPVDQKEAFIHILEEATDVYLCMLVNDIFPDMYHLEEKLDRWYGRVKEVNHEQ